jgi:hypothetical protein
MNASGRPNTCKSNGNRVAIPLTSGVRVRNAYTICPILEHSLGKLRVILHNIALWHHSAIKAQAVSDECASD